MRTSFKLNGSQVHVEVEDNETLLETLRERLETPSPKGACTQGVCGLCTVLINGQPIKSCLVLTGELEGDEVITLEGLERDELMKVIKESFVSNNGFQCGFCTSAFLLRSYSLLRNVRPKNRDEIRAGLAGVLCRCTGYKSIVDSVEEAASKVKGDNE
ncbi:carbon-monoxide dehydrogenase small subunit [Sulfodiicoccus acidiphilus]|uniref:Carbon-monoxide dehydrogenase small subunit n=1 Tax=Sulfodiicoccus acidiphilus TaxID=1670455 RepID=A0A348B6D0_9CREN|nr:(2Fe-2S)-binding protein [Sulfodiicoccus acidiphilus]BBD73732.1 carbon-monoxide dehydrogenase small subunit [Sulfodiicoccus acidiphilus]GGT97942.1 carbon-monoxide dehydrogenase small subunit [Sulfodiicoccus acidiphilus]